MSVDASESATSDLRDEILFQGLPGKSPGGFPSNDELLIELKELLPVFKTKQKIKRPVTLSFSLVTDGEMQQLNRDYRGKDRTTDVLSFSQVEGMDFPDSGPMALGDIVISRQQCIKQAAEKGHSPLHELRILTIHGLYHLLGYDHETSEEDAVHMEKLEKQLLNLFLKKMSAR
ncbi:MAG TPA: rRNA maturation RNase YbeY [Leptospiraceae bacterium]|nr:rRNA maturation RNase YbeY [Spirochaetaceae bacterium]HBS06797.1 rRNA maturation RNase YbeY [Leptospiraceae bacterium]|tara:strand:- start:3288 stop:3809 length:522 start_codon:yes stop_codon:yes gene_type:complete